MSARELPHGFLLHTYVVVSTLDGSSDIPKACGVDSVLIAGGSATPTDTASYKGYKPRGITYIPIRGTGEGENYKSQSNVTEVKE